MCNLVSPKIRRAFNYLVDLKIVIATFSVKWKCGERIEKDIRIECRASQGTDHSVIYFRNVTPWMNQQEKRFQETANLRLFAIRNNHKSYK